MADNVAITAGSGTTIATDEVSIDGATAHVQRVKLTVGVAGSAVDADVNSGNKSAGTLRVVLATDQPALTNKLLVTPDANSAVNIAQINGVATTMGNGASGTGVQRVTIASDSTGQIALAAGSANVGVVTVIAKGTLGVDVSKTRPADTTAYAVGDVISNSTSAGTVWTFANAVSAATKASILRKAVFTTSNPAATPLQGRLHLFDTTVASNLNDNAAMSISDAEILTYLGFIDFQMTALANNSVAVVPNLGMDIQAASGATSIFGVLEARNAYTPANAEVIQIRLHFEYIT